MVGLPSSEEAAVLVTSSLHQQILRVTAAHRQIPRVHNHMLIVRWRGHFPRQRVKLDSSANVGRRSVDILAELMNGLRFRGAMYFNAQFSDPWSVRIPRHGHSARIHMVLSGNCWIGAEGGTEDQELAVGDCAIVTDGREHILRDTPLRSPSREHAIPPDDAASDIEQFNPGGTGPYDVELFCGYVPFDDLSTFPLAAALPPLLVIRASHGGLAAQLQPVIANLQACQLDGFPGKSVILQRFAEILFIEAVSLWVRDGSQKTGLIAAISDANVGRAIKLMHKDPRYNWTVRELAKRSGQSRTAFALRFSVLLGYGPIEYLTSLRLGLARRLLHDIDLAIEKIADKAGYVSTAAFIRAFRRHFAITPGAFRRAR